MQSGNDQRKHMVMGELNRRTECGAIRLVGTMDKAARKLKAEILTNRYTTRWDELPAAHPK